MFKRIVYMLIVPLLVLNGTIIFAQTAEKKGVEPVGTVILVNKGKSVAVVRASYLIPLKNGDILIHGSIINGRILTVINDARQQETICSIDKDADKVSVGDTVYRFDSTSLRENGKVDNSAADTGKKIQKQRIRILDETKFSLGAFVRRSDYRSNSSLYTYNGSPGVAGGFLNLRDRGNSFKFQYKRPQFSGKKNSADEYSGEGRFNSFLDKPNNIAVYGNAGLHYLKDAKNFDTSSYASAKLSLRALDLFSDPEFSYEQKYYFDDYSGDRKKTGDYTASLKIRPLKGIIPDIFKTSFTLFYASENYAEKKSTLEKEGKKGFRDFSSEFYVDEKYLRAGLLWSRIIDNDWQKITGAHQFDYYAAIKIDLDELLITLRYDYLKQNDSTILKKQKKHLAEAEGVYSF
jgi:hypothetical protein